MKIINSIFYLLLLSFFITSCGEDDSTDQPKTDHSNSEVQTMTHDGIEREYMLYLPEAYDANSPVPVLLNFHGFGDKASGFMDYTDMRSLAETNNFILVYPQGSLEDGASHWNPCPIGGDNKSTADDVGFIEAMIEKISAEFSIDKQRIYAAGYSNGGMMAYGLANYKSELIAAVASVSGAMLDCTNPVSHPMPVLHLHGTNDGIIPYDGGLYYTSVQKTLDHWIEINNTTTTPAMQTSNDGSTEIELYIYAQGDQSVSVEHYKYLDGGHVWFSNKYDGKTTGQLIWEFVSRYDLNGLR